MREIIFRGKVIESTVKEVGEWVYGHLVARKEHDDGPEQCFICEEGHIFIRCLNKMPCTYKVDPKTVGQYTGLKDKNGKRIFEGDIVHGDNWMHSSIKIYEVAFVEAGFYFVDDSGTMWHDDHIENVEVICNIHVNSELLGEEHE